MVCIFLITAIYAEAGISDKNAKLIQASEKGNFADVQAVLTDGADINATEVREDSGVYVRGLTALMMASTNGRTEVVKLLLDKGAEVNLKNNYGITALFMASANGHTEIVKLLLDKGAEVNVKNTDDGVTALFMASANGHTGIVKLLLDKGADVNVKNTYGITALFMASAHGHTEVARLLLDKWR